MAEHTPGPWHVGQGHASVYAQPHLEQGPNFRQVASVSDPDDHMHFTPINKANARRIVAAVNACEGIPTEALERDTQPLADEIRGLSDQNIELEAKSRRLVAAGADLRRQNAELLEALEKAYRLIDANESLSASRLGLEERGKNRRQALAVMEAAIEKAKS